MLFDSGLTFVESFYFFCAFLSYLSTLKQNQRLLMCIWFPFFFFFFLLLSWLLCCISLFNLIFMLPLRFRVICIRGAHKALVVYLVPFYPQSKTWQEYWYFPTLSKTKRKYISFDYRYTSNKAVFLSRVSKITVYTTLL